MSDTPDFTNFATEHPNYFPGQYLLEEDFELQHKYLSDRQKYYKQSLHVSGIIEGLEVEVIEDKKKVNIQPGSAIDSEGNLIVLKEEKTKDIPDGGGELYIEFSHQENEDTEQQENIKESFTRWKEEPILAFANTTPDDCVKLAKLTISGETITLEPNVREYSGLSLPNSNGKALTLRSDGNANSNLAVLSGSLKIDGDLTVNEVLVKDKGDKKGKITLGDTSISQFKTDSNFNKDHDAVPTVGAVYAYIQQVLAPKEPLVFDLGDNVVLEMVYIPGGTFLMGSPDGEGASNEHPQHEVHVPPFYIGKYPVTNAQWIAVMDNSIPDMIKPELDPDLQNHPWEGPWYVCYGNEVQNFCKVLTTKMDSKGNWEFRLPSEAQWEYACRAGTETKYYFGDNDAQLGEYAWHQQNSKNETKPVGLKKPNEWGLYDMYGNVAEWCEDDWHNDYKGATTDGRAWLNSNGEKKVHRGGSSQRDPYYIRSASRSSSSRKAFGDIGFRVVAVINK